MLALKQKIQKSIHFRSFSTFVVVFALTMITACETGKEEQSEADSNLIIGLLAGQEQGRQQGRTDALRFVTEFNGNWDVGFSYDANGQLTGTLTGRWILSTNPDGSGSIISTANPAGFDDTTYRILSYNSTTRQLFYQNTPGTNNFSPSTFGRIDFTEVTTTGCERNASKCFYFCERVFGQSTLAAAEGSSLTSNTASPTAANSCDTARFSRALFRADNSTL